MDRLMGEEEGEARSGKRTPARMEMEEGQSHLQMRRRNVARLRHRSSVSTLQALTLSHRCCPHQAARSRLHRLQRLHRQQKDHLLRQSPRETASASRSRHPWRRPPAPGLETHPMGHARRHSIYFLLKEPEPLQQAPSLGAETGPRSAGHVPRALLRLLPVLLLLRQSLQNATFRPA